MKTESDSTQCPVRRYVVATAFTAECSGRHWWNSNYTTRPHRMTIVTATDGETAEAIAAVKDRAYWEKDIQNLETLTLISIVWMELPKNP